MSLKGIVKKFFFGNNFWASKGLVHSCLFLLKCYINWIFETTGLLLWLWSTDTKRTSFVTLITAIRKQIVAMIAPLNEDYRLSTFCNSRRAWSFSSCLLSHESKVKQIVSVLLRLQCCLPEVVEFDIRKNGCDVTNNQTQVECAKLHIYEAETIIISDKS